MSKHRRPAPKRKAKGRNMLAVETWGMGHHVHTPKNKYTRKRKHKGVSYE